MNPSKGVQVRQPQRNALGHSGVRYKGRPGIGRRWLKWAETWEVQRRYWLALVTCGCLSTAPTPRQLVEQLGGAQCVSSYEVLDQRQDLPTATAIAAGLQDSNPRVRSQCLRLLGSKQDTQWVEPMVPLLNDTEAVVYQQAARSLLHLLDTAEIVQLLDGRRIGAPAKAFLITLVLKDALELASPELQAWLLKPQPAATQTLIFRTLRDNWSPCLARKCARTPELKAQLDLAHARLAQHALEAAMRVDLPQGLRVSALTLYACFGGPESFPRLQRWALSQSSPSWLRQAALLGLGLSQHPQAVPILARQAGDETAALDVRLAAARGLGKMFYDRQAQQALISLLQSPQPKIRWRALVGLGYLGDQDCLAAVRQECSTEADPQVRVKAQETLSRLELRAKGVGD